MKIWAARYELLPSRSLSRHAQEAKPRQGALIRVEFPGKGFGYADVHPWVELGDAPLEAQLESLKSGELTPLTRQSMHFADLDARARSAGRSIFEGLEIPPSHVLITDPLSLDETALGLLAQAGFERIKLKAGRDLAREAERFKGMARKLSGKVKLRIDLNAGADATALDVFLTAMESIRDRIDFIEDPMPWSAEAWAIQRARHGVRFALDREVARAQAAGAPLGEAVDVLVIKPAVQRIEITSRPRVYTSYLDHPLGQVFAAYEAARAAKTSVVEVCGLVSHLAYAPTAYSERLQARGPRLLPPAGEGAGFGDLLENEKWEELR